MLAFIMPGGWEWLVVLFVALLIFGSRLPSVMRAMGKSVTEFKKGMHEVGDEIASGEGDDDQPAGDGGADSNSPAG